MVDHGRVIHPSSPSDPGRAADGGVPLPSRRQVIVGAAAALVLAGCGGDDGASPTTTVADGDTTASSSASTTAGTTTTIPPEACVLSPELAAGPYHLDGHLARADITEGRPGVPLEFRVKVLALPDCTPLEGAAVDVWHCDAGGEYSGFEGNSLGATQAGGTNDERFLRGVQLTDVDGVATFTTIFPGWYEGRTVHIHLQVLEGGTLADTYAGGHVAHVGQAFFDEDLTADLMATGAYAARTGTRLTNEQDSIFGQGGSGTITTLTAVGSDPTDGYVGEFTCMVDPDATPDPAPLF